MDAFDNPSAETDLAHYRSQYGLPACTSQSGCFRKVNQRGEAKNYPKSNKQWAEETSLDLDMVSATCPNCNILLVQADNASDKSLESSIDQAVTLGAHIVSTSFGEAEKAFTKKIRLQDETHYNHPGTEITASSGDSGYGAEYPATSKYVTTVGGTTLKRDTSSRGWNEVAWVPTKYGVGFGIFGGTGSGCSAYIAKPSWQSDSGCKNRTEADVSAVADGLSIYDSFGFKTSPWHVVGGTSASSPLVAAVYGLTGATTFQNASNLYADPSGLFDVTKGTNGFCYPFYLCNAGTGYDGPTGLGTPNGIGAFGGDCDNDGDPGDPDEQGECVAVAAANSSAALGRETPAHH